MRTKIIINLETSLNLKSFVLKGVYKYEITNYEE